MAAHNTLGKTGEDAAVAYLERNGYTINHRNWRKTVSNWTLWQSRTDY